MSLPVFPRGWVLRSRVSADLDVLHSASYLLCWSPRLVRPPETWPPFRFFFRKRGTGLAALRQGPESVQGKH